MPPKKIKVVMQMYDDTEATGDRTKNRHIAYVNEALLHQFRTQLGVVNYIAWVREQAKKSFDITIATAEDLAELKSAVEYHHYDDIGEWLQDLMRTALRDHQKENRRHD